MGVIQSGILSKVSGKVAGVVGGSWKDKAYLRSYVIPANPNTAAQQTQRTKMSDAVNFCKTLVGPVFNAYTDPFQKKMSGFNFFVKRNIDEFDGSPTWANIKITEGKLFGVGTSAATYNIGSGLITITYYPDTGNNGSASDKIYACAYYTSEGYWYFPAAETIRSGGTITMQAGTSMVGINFETWIWAIKKAGTVVELISDSGHRQCTQVS
jgi:hypothetical protein